MWCEGRNQEEILNHLPGTEKITKIFEGSGEKLKKLVMFLKYIINNGDDFPIFDKHTCKIFIPKDDLVTLVRFSAIGAEGKTPECSQVSFGQETQQVRGGHVEAENCILIVNW